MQSPKCQKKGVCLIKMYSELKPPRVKSWAASDDSRARCWVHALCIEVCACPVLESYSCSRAEMVIDGIHKCHHCWHCVGRWLWDCFSVVMMIIFPFILLLQAMQSSAWFFQCGNGNQDVHGNKCMLH